MSLRSTVDDNVYHDESNQARGFVPHSEEVTNPKSYSSSFSVKTFKMEQCVICWENLVDQVIGIPEHCQHVFCFQCLSNWSQVRGRERKKGIFSEICFSKIIHVQMIGKRLGLFSKNIRLQVEGLMLKYD